MAKRSAVPRHKGGFVGVRVSPAEKADLMVAAQRRGMSISEMVRTSVMRAMHEAPPSNVVAG